MIGTTHEVDLTVFRRYAGLSLPRHVSYPMPTWWHDVDAAEAGSMHRSSDRQTPGCDLALYVHIPFCESLCRYCACNRIILPKNAKNATERVDRYLMALQGEIRQLAVSAGGDRPLRQIHWGGGSPTYLTTDQVQRVHRTISETFELAPDAEVAMEIDPRGVTPQTLRCLRDIGFNRVSMGVQDFDEQVQKHVRRIQSFEMVRDVVDVCRNLGFNSVNFDLIYGMPYQTPETIHDTVEKTIALSPDRIAYYHYAQIPEKIATQRGMDYAKLPDSEMKLQMFLIGLELFEAAGYEFVGLDHFAKPDEALSQALKDGTVQRNFQGMTTGGGLRLLGVGVSSISHLLDMGFLQNVKDIDHYVARIENGELPVERGKRFTFDDRVRQAVINQLYCTTQVQPETIERRFDICFADYFSRELEIMSELERDGLVTVNSTGVIRATCPLGRVLVRNVAAVFDAYLDPEAYRKGEQACFSANA
ncbi:MAG: oxygen-independent coproporphyrinogen III oxidase [Phycisphaerae bacterium]